MFDNFTPQALRAVVLAQREARQFGHREIGTDHLLLGLALEGKGTAALTLASLQAAPEEIRRLVAEAAEPGPERAMDRLPFTAGATGTLRQAAHEASLAGEQTGTGHLLLALAGQSAEAAALVLTQIGAHPEIVLRRARALMQSSVPSGIKPDNGGLRHYVDNGTAAGDVVTALCGWTWIRQAATDAPSDLPVCPECGAAFSSLPEQEDDLSEEDDDDLPHGGPLLVRIEAARPGVTLVAVRLGSSFFGQAEIPASAAWPMGDAALEDLRWYLEDYLSAPYGVYESRGLQVEACFRAWGERLFAALFRTEALRDVYRAFRAQARQAADPQLVVSSRSPAWLSLPWELLRDPEDDTPVALSGISITRALTAGEPRLDVGARGEPLRVLMVISRPAGARDVGYHNIARPLLRALTALRGRVDVKVLRPPTISSLQTTLEGAATAGCPFHIVHFDGHGALASDSPGPGRPEGAYASTAEGMLAFEKPSGGTDAVSAGRIAEILSRAAVPLVVLNACQSGAVGRKLEAAVATRLLAAGVPSVVAMAYSVYADAAAGFMTDFYERLFAGQSTAGAVRAGRERLAWQAGRPSPKGRQRLEDWLVPVLYQERDVRFPGLHADVPSDHPAARSGADNQREREIASDREMNSLPEDEEFIGRDSEIYALESALGSGQPVLVHGAGGTGKTELAKAFGRWWRDSGGVQRPDAVIWYSFERGMASFGLAGLASQIGLKLGLPRFSRLDLPGRIGLIGEFLKENRMLLLLDNFESVASMPDESSVAPPLDDVGRTILGDFIRQVAGEENGAVLITSRTPESWLGDLRRIPLAGLPPPEAVQYADRLLSALPSAQPRRGDKAFGELLEWLDGHPLCMRVTLPQLAATGAADILASLRGEAMVGQGEQSGERDRVLSACVSYSASQLDAAERRLLVLVSLFSGAVSTVILAQLCEDDRIPPKFRGIDLDMWDSVLGRAAEVGLLGDLGDGWFAVHPALPAFLAEEWEDADPRTFPADRAAVRTGLLGAYAEFCQWAVYEADPDEAFRLVHLERQTLGQLLGYALENRQWTDARHLAVTLNRYWFNAGMAAEADAWVERARNALGVAGGNAPSPESPAGALWRTLLSSQATRLLNAGRTAEAASIRAEISPQPQPGSPQESMRDAADSHQHAGEIAQESGDWPDAEQRYRRSAELAEQLGDQGRVSRAATQLAVMLQKRRQWDDAERWYGRAVEAALQSGNDELLANAYHWRGTLAQDRKEWDQAERWYYRALAIREEANDKVGVARLFHQMGIVAQVRGQWNDAESWYRRALVILEETEQRIPLANTYTQLGMMDYQRGRLATAEDWYQRALEIASAAGNPSTIATLNHLLGAVAQQSGQWEVAENRYTASLSALEEIGDDYHVALCARQLAVVARRNGRLGQAKAWADRVQHLAAVLGDGQLVAWSKRFALSLAED